MTTWLHISDPYSRYDDTEKKRSALDRARRERAEAAHELLTSLLERVELTPHEQRLRERYNAAGRRVKEAAKD